MKKLYCCFAILLLLASCKKNAAALLEGRWDFTALDMPGMPEFLYQLKTTGDDNATTLKKFLLGNKLILRKDSTFDLVLLKQYIHGNWKFNAANKDLLLKDNSAAALNLTVHIDSIHPSQLIFDMDEFTLNKMVQLHASEKNAYHLLLNKSYCQFYLNRDKDRYSDLKDDPYSIINNQWRIKPGQPETDRQIKERVLNHIDFWYQLCKDGYENDRFYISYTWFSSPLVVASTGVQLQFYEAHKTEWDKNFYDSVEAKRGFEMMRKCFTKKIIYLNTDNRFERMMDIIRQLRTNYMTALGK